MPDQSNFSKFSTLLQGLDLYDRKTGIRIYKYTIFDDKSWWHTAQSILDNTHPTISFRMKNNAIKKLYSTMPPATN